MFGNRVLRHEEVDPSHSLMDAHAQLGTAASADTLRWIFSSPVLLLLDEFDTLSCSAERGNFRPTAASAPGPTTGVRACLPTTWSLTFGSLGVRSPHSVDERVQCEGFIRQQLKSHELMRDVVRLLDVPDKPVASLIRIPYLLSKVCGMAQMFRGHNLEELTLYELMAWGSARMQSKAKVGGDDADFIVYSRLPELALKQKTTWAADTDVEALTLDRASQMGFLRSNRPPLRFTHQILRDFFAALGIEAEYQRTGFACLREYLTARPELCATGCRCFRCYRAACTVWRTEGQHP